MSSTTSRSSSRQHAAAVLTVAALLSAGCSSSTGARSHPTTARPAAVQDAYGGLPSFLPSAGARPDRMLTGSSQSPALTVEGDSVRVLLGDGAAPRGAAVTMTVSGPVVPGEGLPHASPAPTCTWTVSVSGSTSPVPLAAAAFTTQDHLGAVYRPAFVPGAPRPPAVLRPGAHVTFELRAVMPAGEGLMRWAPTGHTVASWDFEVEND